MTQPKTERRGGEESSGQQIKRKTHLVCSERVKATCRRGREERRIKSWRSHWRGRWEGRREGRREGGREVGKVGWKGRDVLVGSSRKITAGSVTSSIPIETRLRSPPDTPYREGGRKEKKGE